MTDKLATGITYSSAASAVLFGLTANELAALLATAVAIASFCVNWYYKHRYFRLAEATTNSNVPPTCRGCQHAVKVFNKE